jgi:hypothetical protein
MFSELVDRLNVKSQKRDTWFRNNLELGLKLSFTLKVCSNRRIVQIDYGPVGRINDP